MTLRCVSREWRLELCEPDLLLPPPLRARQAACLDRAPAPVDPNPQKRTPTRSRHRAPRICASPEHQVCEFLKPAVQTTRIVLAIRTFDGPVLRATRNSVILTMWPAPPCPALARPGDIVKNHHGSSASSAMRPAATRPRLQSRPHRAPHHAARRTTPTTLPPWPWLAWVTQRTTDTIPLIRGPAPGSLC